MCVTISGIVGGCGVRIVVRILFVREGYVDRCVGQWVEIIQGFVGLRYLFSLFYTSKYNWSFLFYGLYGLVRASSGDLSVTFTLVVRILFGHIHGYISGIRGGAFSGIGLVNFSGSSFSVGTTYGGLYRLQLWVVRKDVSAWGLGGLFIFSTSVFSRFTRSVASRVV